MVVLLLLEHVRYKLRNNKIQPENRGEGFYDKPIN
jgi:hypothetical protein